VFISNVSFPKKLEEEIAVKGKSCSLILPYILKSVKQLENANVHFIVMPCNTLHVLLPDIRKSTHLEVLDLVEEVSSYVKNKYKVVGILSTKKTRTEKLYDKKLEDLILIYPSYKEQEKISQVIVRIIRNKSTKKDKQFLEKVIKKMIKCGAEKVILACTDIANLIKNNKDTLDSTEILIEMIKNKMNETNKSLQSHHLIQNNAEDN
jgi:aspartate racemase